jgi:hypothetical protein
MFQVPGSEPGTWNPEPGTRNDVLRLAAAIDRVPERKKDEDGDDYDAADGKREFHVGLLMTD